MTIRYVAPTGGSDNNPGDNEAQPLATILHGVAQTGANDLLLLRGGVHTGPGARIDNQGGGVVHSGTSYDNAVTIAGYPGETAVVTPDWNWSGVRLFSQPCSYVILKDIVFSFENSGPGVTCEGVALYLCDHIQFDHVTVRNLQTSQFGVHAAHDTPFIWIHDSLVQNISRPDTIQGQGHGLYLTGSDGVFEDNEVADCDGYGFHVYGNELVGVAKDPSRNKVRRNRIHDCGVHGSQEAAIVFAWGADNEAQNNEIWRCPVGVQLYTNSSNAQANNNTIDGCDVGLWAQYYLDAPSARNNILTNCRTPFIDYGGGGLYTRVRRSQARAYVAIFSDNLVSDDPRFVDAAGHDYRLQQNSPALDAGVTIASVTDDFYRVPRPQGTTHYDMGAHERVGERPTPPDPPDPPDRPDPPEPTPEPPVADLALLAATIAAGLVTVPPGAAEAEAMLDTAVAYAEGIVERTRPGRH